MTGKIIGRRKYNGAWYYPMSFRKTKAEAQKAANTYRAKGYLTRVRKSSKGYEIFVKY